jgi:pimeloyl-ACP methyl ester carboxylesterase
MIRKGYVDSLGGQVHFRMTERNAGISPIPLLLLHQTASSSAMFEAVMAELASNYFCVALDTPGFGNSFVPTGEVSVGYYAGIFQQTLAQLDISRYNLFGHHTGAAIAVQMAHDYPQSVAKLILCGPPLLSDDQIAYLRAGLKPIVPTRDGAHWQPTWDRLTQKEPTTPVDLLQREALLTQFAQSSYLAAYEAVFAQDFRGLVEKLTQPTLVFAGDKDSLIASLEPTHQLLQNSQKQVVKNAGTYICDRQPKIVANLLRNFLEE